MAIRIESMGTGDRGRNLTAAAPRRGTVLAALALIAAAGTAAPAARAAESLALKSRLRPVSIYDQKVSMQMTLTMQMSGVPDDQAEAAAALTKGMTQEMEIALAMELGELGDDGAMPLEVRIESMKSAMIMAGQRIEPPMAAQEGMTLMSGRITPQGKIVEMEVEGLDEAPSAMVDQLLKMMPEIPDTTLRPGESFEIPVNMNLPIQGAAGAVEGRAVYTLKEVTAGEARFDVQQNFSMGMEGLEAEEMTGMTLTVDGGGSGTAVFDLAEKVFTRMDIEMDLKAHMKGAGPAMAATAPDGAAQQTFSLEVSARGPVAMTLTRRTDS